MKRTPRWLAAQRLLWGPPVYTKRDLSVDLLRFADMTSANGNRRPGPHGRDVHWRARLGRLLVLALRGVP